MEAYWNTLPTHIQSAINSTGIDLCSLGMLTKLGDYYKNMDAQKEPERKNVKLCRRNQNGKEKSPGCPDPARTGSKKPIPAEIYPVIDTDLGRDNLENDLPAADLEDL